MSTNVLGNTLDPVSEAGPSSDSFGAWRIWAVSIGKAINYLLRGGVGVTLNTTVGDAAYSILPSDEVIETSTPFTAARIWTLPPANSVDAGYEITIIDAIATIGAANTLTIAPSGSDTIDNLALSPVLSVAGSAITLVSDGLSNWAIKSQVGSLSTNVTIAGTLNVATGYYVNGQKGATGQFTPANPAGTASLVGVMMGLGSAATITPKSTGTVVFIISGVGANTTANDGFNAHIRYGTGGAPANGAALTGTFTGAIGGGTVTANNQLMDLSVNGLVSGLSVGTTYWIDLAVAAITGGTASVINVSITAFELTV